MTGSDLCSISTQGVLVQPPSRCGDDYSWRQMFQILLLQTWSRILAKTHFNYPLPTIVTPGYGRLSTGVKCCYCTPDDARLFLAALSSIDPANHHNTPRWYATKGSQFHTNHPSRIMDFVAHGVWISGQMEDDNPASLLLIRGLENWERHQTSQRHFWARK